MDKNKEIIERLLRSSNNLTQFYLEMKLQFKDKYRDEQINEMWFTGKIINYSPTSS